MKKEKLMISVFTMLFMFAFLLVPSYKLYASESFQKDENGNYHIATETDWSAFLQQMLNGEMFMESTVVLDDDISINGEAYDGCLFMGTFDGKGHTITYTNEDMTIESAVFPVYLYGGTIKNVNINVENSKIDASKHSGIVHGTVLASYGLNDGVNDCSVDSVNIYGNIKVVADETHANNIECSGIDIGYSKINNSIVNIEYDLENESLNSFLSNSNDLRLRMKLFQFGYSQVDSMSLSKCYSLGSYSESYKQMGTKIQQYYDEKETVGNDEFVLITPFGGDVSRYEPPSEEYCYYNADKASYILFGSDQSKVTSTTYYFNDDSMPKSTADLKKQETFVDYDFDNVWGISEYINDGYPYLQALVSKDLVDLVDQITALPAEDKLTKDNKEAVDRLKASLEALSDPDKALIDVDALTDKVTKAEEAIKALDSTEKQDTTTQTKPATTQTQPSPTQAKPATTIAVKKGTTFTVKGYKYKVTGTSVKNPTVTITGYKNKKLKKISVPAAVTYKKVKFKVTAVANNAFKGQKKATSVVIAKNVKTIGKSAFYGDAKVKKITVKSTVLTKVGAKAFKGLHKKAVIKVPAKKLKAYKKLMKSKGQAKTVKIKK